MADTFFAYLKGTASNANDTDPEQSSCFYNPPMSGQYNVLYYRRESAPLDDGENRGIVLPNYSVGSWLFIMARVVGEVSLDVAGTDWDGVSSISSTTYGYGTERYPGVITLSTANVTGAPDIDFVGHADGSTVEYIIMVAVPDSSL